MCRGYETAHYIYTCKNTHLYIYIYPYIYPIRFLGPPFGDKSKTMQSGLTSKHKPWTRIYIHIQIYVYVNRYRYIYLFRRTVSIPDPQEVLRSSLRRKVDEDGLAILRNWASQLPHVGQLGRLSAHLNAQNKGDVLKTFCRWLTPPRSLCQSTGHPSPERCWKKPKPIRLPKRSLCAAARL